MDTPIKHSAMPNKPNALFNQLQPYCVTTNGLNCIYSIPAKKLIELTKSKLIEQWSSNRPPDMKRVRAIKKYVEAKGYIDGCLYFAYMVNPKDDESDDFSDDADNTLVLCCYDGNHRRLAITEKPAVENVDSILIGIIWNATQDIIIEQFRMINMSVSVSSIHLETNIDKNMKSTIEKYVVELCGTYSAMVSKSERCQSPNFHREVLQTNLHEIMKSDAFNKYSSTDIIKYVKEMNRCYRKEKYEFYKEDIKERARDKCEESGLWLFAEERTLNRKYLTTVIKNSKYVPSKK